MHPQPRKHALLTASALAACLVAGTIAFAQEKKEEEPFWAKGRPKGDVTAKMAPVAAPPVPTPEAQLPKLTVPPGFKVEVYQSGILDARGLRRGDKGTVFVSSLFVAGKIYAVTGEKGKRTTKVIAEKLELPNGIEFNKGSLYVATPKQITRYDKIEDNLDKPPEPVKVFDALPGDIPHGWKFIKFGPDGKLYVPVGAPCNICESDPDKYMQIFRINADGSGKEIIARGVRNTVGFDFHPRTKELWFTDNQRDWLAEDMPLDELAKHSAAPLLLSSRHVDPEVAALHELPGPGREPHGRRQTCAKEDSRADPL
jgi:glucose/arabinose dehydrogenase